jgi:serine/threonine-protein kinase HipA
MTFRPVERLAVFYEPEEGRRIPVGRLARRERDILFEYDPGFIVLGLELSPRKLPLLPGLVIGKPEPFRGLMGVFEDSLPDGWGRLLMDRRAQQAGIRAAQLGPLDRLSLVGSRAMGALVYAPEVELEAPSIVSLSEIADDTAAVLRDASGPDLDRLVALGGSPQGARPKVLVQLSGDGSMVHGDARSRPGCSWYLVKFRARQDDKHIGVLEHAYMNMAKTAGIDVPKTVLLGRSAKHPGYFAVERFDRSGKHKTHMHTVSGMLEVPPSYPAIGYRELLLLTRELTRDEGAVTEMFRRACFNVFAHNRDDHTRNFAFLMDERGNWRVSPAYDLCYSDGPGGEHTMLIGREGANPGEKHLVELAQATDIKHPKPIVESVRTAVNDFPRFADEAGLPAAKRNRFAELLGIRKPASRKRR